MWYIVRLDSSRVATLVKVRSATLVSSSDPTRVKSNYIPVETTILRQIERCLGRTQRECIGCMQICYGLNKIIIMWRIILIINFDKRY